MSILQIAATLTLVFLILATLDQLGRRIKELRSRVDELELQVDVLDLQVWRLEAIAAQPAVSGREGSR